MRGLNRCSTALVCAVAVVVLLGAGAQAVQAATVAVVKNNNFGVGEIFETDNPQQSIHVKRAAAQILVERTGAAAAATLFRLSNAGVTRFGISNSSAGLWNFEVNNGNGFSIDRAGGGGIEMLLTSAGNMTITGNYFSAVCVSPSPCAPDYVFEPDYPLMPIGELAEFVMREKHLPNVPSAEEMTGPINISKLQMTLLEKIEELVLYTVEQQKTIDGQQKLIAGQQHVIDGLQGRLEALESRLGSP